MNLIQRVLTVFQGSSKIYAVEVKNAAAWHIAIGKRRQPLGNIEQKTVCERVPERIDHRLQPIQPKQQYRAWRPGAR